MASYARTNSISLARQGRWVWRVPRHVLRNLCQQQVNLTSLGSAAVRATHMFQQCVVNGLGSKSIKWSKRRGRWRQALRCMPCCSEPEYAKSASMKSVRRIEILDGSWPPSSLFCQLVTIVPGRLTCKALLQWTSVSSMLFHFAPANLRKTHAFVPCGHRSMASKCSN